MNNEEFEMSSTDVIQAADTIEETIAIRNNNLVKNTAQEKSKFSAIPTTTINIDDAKWQKEYAAKMERNLDRFKELGLYTQLQDLGIVYDPKQFRKSHAIARTTDGKQISSDVAMDSYEETERQFDEQIENELVKKDNSKEDKKS